MSKRRTFLSTNSNSWFKKYTSHCYENQKDKTIDIISINTLLGVFSCIFNNVKSYDNHKRGAVFISVNYEFDDIYLQFFVYNYTFDYKCTANEGGTFYIDSIGSYTLRVFEIQNCKFISNECFKENEKNSFGGAIFITSYLQNFEISESEFESNEASNGGAIYYTTSSSSSFSKVLLDDEDYSLKIVDCKFINNKVTSNGAAVCLIVKNGERKKAFEIINCNFFENKWSGIEEENPENGGAIYFDIDVSSSKNKIFEFHVFDCTFYQNSASSKGGAICISNPKNEILKSI